MRLVSRLVGRSIDFRVSPVTSMTNDSLPPASEITVSAEPELPFPVSGRLLGVDFGTVRIGISVCDPLRILVSPLEIRMVAAREADGRYFIELAKREAASGFVVGLPIHCDGGESEKSRQARTFAVWLQKTTEIPVRLFDERFTTSAAQQRVSGGQKKKKGTRARQIDAIAAQVLLESFLEAARYRGETPGQSPWAAASGDQPLD
jgi:putative Holliday junction resolvase